MRLQNLCIGAFSVAMAAAAVNAAPVAVNVNFYSTTDHASLAQLLNGQSNPTGGGTTVSPMAYTGSTWNDLDKTNNNYPGYSYSLLDSTGAISALTYQLMTEASGGT